MLPFACLCLSPAIGHIDRLPICQHIRGFSSCFLPNRRTVVCSLVLSVTGCRAPRPQISLWSPIGWLSWPLAATPVRLFGDSFPVPGLFGGLVGAGCGQFGNSVPVPGLFGWTVGARRAPVQLAGVLRNRTPCRYRLSYECPDFCFGESRKSGDLTECQPKLSAKLLS